LLYILQLNKELITYITRQEIKNFVLYAVKVYSH